VNSNQQLKRMDGEKSKENIPPNSNATRKISQPKRTVHKKRPSNQEMTLHKNRPASSLALIQKPNHNTSHQSSHFESDRHCSHLKTLHKGKRHNFSQTKFVCNQKPRESLQRRRKTANKYSGSKSSCKKPHSRNSASTKKSKSQTGSEQTRLHNELA
jgi:hypothetical protein